MFNYSEWLGSASTIALSNLYHPGNRLNTGEMASRMGFLVGMDAGFDVLREFWPKIAHSMKFPFRGLRKGQKPGLAESPR
jgi:hypothetical protein